MYADRYAPRRVNPGSLTLSVSIVGGLVAAVMLSPTIVRLKPPGPDLRTFIVPPAPPPPPPEPVPQPKAAAKTPAPPIEASDPVQPTLPDDLYRVRPADPGPPPDLGGTGTGAASVVEPIKPPPPVLTDTQVDPRYARDFQPLYPPAELRAGRDGAVTLRVLVGVDGRVVRAEQVAASSDAFWRVTLKQALGRWRFKPATRDGIPVEAWRTMTVRFRVEDQ